MSEKILEVCAYCSKVKDWHGEYNANMVIGKEEQKHSRTDDISHGICVPCMLKEIDKMETKNESTDE